MRLRCRRRGSTIKRDLAGLRRVAQPGIGTALPAQTYACLAPRRDDQFEAAAIDLLITEELVAVRLARGQRRLALGRQAVELQALLVEVIARRDLPVQARGARLLRADGQGEGLIDRQEIGLRTGAEQAAGRQRETGRKQKQAKQQGAHEHSLQTTKTPCSMPAAD